MEIKIALTNSQYRQLISAFSAVRNGRPIQLVHHVRHAVEEHRSVLKNSVLVGFVRWYPTDEERSAVEAEIRGLIDSVVTPVAATIEGEQAAFEERHANAVMFQAVAGAVNLRQARKEYGRRVKALRI